MSYCHRNGDARLCGATTVVTGQNFVTVAGALWAVEGDTETHGDGAIQTSNPWLTINGKGIIVVNDFSEPDDLCPVDSGAHCTPYAVGYSLLVNVN